jgi:glycosyltransferase involved in cell wall biosynthesis
MTAAFAAALSTDVPLMITFRGSDLNKVPMASGLRPALGHLLSQLAALRAAWMVCVSRGLREQLWWKRKCATVLPSGVDTDAFQPMPQAEARAALGWPEEGRVVLFNAGHDPVNKRLDLALAAVQEAARTIADLRIEVVSGQVAPELMPLYMNAADCLLVTSDAEGSPTVVQEALVTELPVVSVNVGDIQDRLRGISPSAIATRDPHMLAEALCTVLAAGRRSNGRSRVREICSTHIADELAHLYRQVIATRHPGRIPTWSTTHS